VTLPRITVIALGGTIAGSASTTTDATGYRAGTTGVDDLIAAVPASGTVADLTGEQFAQIDSSDLTDELLRDLSRRVSEVAASDDVDGIVVTHGTDTLEETAYYLHLTVKSVKPIVLVGAMRPPTALSADGQRNFYAAVVVAASEASAGHGALVVMNDEIHSARDVSKASSMRLDAFESPYGPLGVVVDGRAMFYRSVTRRHTVDSEFTAPTSLPTSVIVYAHSGLDAHLIETLAAYDIIVHAGFGNGTVSKRIVDALESLRENGSLIVRASRTGAGHLTRIGASDATANQWIAVDDQNAQRARILASLALTVTTDPAEIQDIFYRY
jgi:glutamin-(asparagin-)ase